MKVQPIKNFECKDWLLNKHYAKRIPSISFAFGLYINNQLTGVCTYGRPVAHALVKGAFNGEYQNDFLELNRLVVNEDLPKNTLSFFVANTLKQLPKPKVIVSYADTLQGHHGYIYQATNWIYTGLSAKRTDWKIKGLEHLHGATIADMSRGQKDRAKYMRDKYGDRFYLEDRPRKHRYFYLLGSKTDKKNMIKNLSYKIEPYPKGNNKRYDASYKPKTQITLF